MPDAVAQASVTDPRGYLLVLAIILPVAGTLLSFVLGGRNAEQIALALIPADSASLSRSSSVSFKRMRH